MDIRDTDIRITDIRDTVKMGTDMTDMIHRSLRMHSGRSQQAAIQSIPPTITLTSPTKQDVLDPAVAGLHYSTCS